MERSEYAKLNEVENEMWWFRGLHANLLTAFRRRARKTPAGHPILDAGCGTGGFLTQLGCDLTDWSALGLDIDPGACAMARAKSGRPVCAGSTDQLPFADRSLAAIFSVDVLCHRKVDESDALRSFHRCLERGGVLVLNLPAYDWLLSAHDSAVHNVRRYSRNGLHRMLANAGFGNIRATYWNTILFPLMVMRRTVFGSRSAESDVMTYPALLETLFRAVMRFENLMLRHGMTLPFGGSILASAVKI